MRKKGGKPAHQPTDQQRRYVEALASYGVPMTDIARVVGVTDRTLQKYYRHQLETGHVRANAEVAGYLFAACKKGSVPAIIFWLRCRARWTVPESETADVPGKKEAAATAARQVDESSPFERVIAARIKRDVGSKLPGLGSTPAEWPVADSRSAA